MSCIRQSKNNNKGAGLAGRERVNMTMPPDSIFDGGNNFRFFPHNCMVTTSIIRMVYTVVVEEYCISIY